MKLFILLFLFFHLQFGIKVLKSDGNKGYAKLENLKFEVLIVTKY